MATLAAQFTEALSNIEPNDDVKHAIEAHKDVTKALKADERLTKLGVDPILIGSYKRHVSIKRIKDVDVFARLTEADETLRPGDILDHVTGVLEDAFPGQVKRQRRSVRSIFPTSTCRSTSSSRARVLTIRTTTGRSRRRSRTTATRPGWRRTRRG